MSQTSPTPSERTPLVADAIPPTLQRQGVSQGRVFAACLIGALVLALFASRDVPGWAERLGDAPFAHRARESAGAWDAAMDRLGVVRPHEALRAAMQRLLDWKWGGQRL